MSWGALLPVYVAMLVTTALGVRLLWLARQTRKLPELLIGLFFLGATGGVLFSVLPLQLTYLSAEQQGSLRLVAELSFGVCGVSIACFTWRVFAVDHPWAVWLCGALVVGEVGTLLMQWLNGGFTAFGAPGRWYQANLAVEVVIYTWATFEPLEHWTHARRRVRIGLADPVLTNRVLLWAVWAGSTVLFMLAWIANEAASTLLPGPDGVQNAFLLAYTVVGLACGLSTWLTFFPPRAYTHWVRERAAVG